jgi:NTP pyrophosphatase (non-canonical NTP hydrolase)
MTENEALWLKEIAGCLGTENILCQLAEECSELSQACLKYRRVLYNLTPKTESEAFDDLTEELADVIANIEQVLYVFQDREIGQKIDKMQSYKTQRWWQRTFVGQKEE